MFLNFQIIWNLYIYIVFKKQIIFNEIFVNIDHRHLKTLIIPPRVSGPFQDVLDMVFIGNTKPRQQKSEIIRMIYICC